MPRGSFDGVARCKTPTVLTATFACAVICVVLPPAVLSAQNGDARTRAKDIPRMPDGKPDLSGVWERPFVIDMSKNGPDQQGEPHLPFTDWAKQHLIEEFDYSGHCLPLGYTRGINSP